MEVISVLITIVSIIMHISSKISNSDGYDYDKTTRDYEPYAPTDKERLEVIYDFKLNKCYKSTKIQTFKIEGATNFLTYNRKFKEFEIIDVLRSENCIYIKIDFFWNQTSLDRQNMIKKSKIQMTSYLSINYIEPNNNVIVFGSSNYKPELENQLFIIAEELTNAL
jgi:hypothetical protein